MNQLTEKLLRNGIIDKAHAALMERMGLLEEGASEIAEEGIDLKHATREQLISIVESLAVEVEREHTIKETYLDLERLRWPVYITVMSPRGDPMIPTGNGAVHGLIDRMGRYYLRAQDVKKEWFVPGHILRRGAQGKNETILEVQSLYIDETEVAIQITTELM